MNFIDSSAQNIGQGIDLILSICKVLEENFYLLLIQVFMLSLVIYPCKVIFSQELLPYVQPLLKVNFKKAEVLK